MNIKLPIFLNTGPRQMNFNKFGGLLFNLLKLYEIAVNVLESLMPSLDLEMKK
jgi:hypothetical protein